MKCTKCGKDIQIPEHAYRNAKTYDKMVLTISKCCGAGYYLTPITKFRITEYKGDQTEDNWGYPIKKQ